MKRVLLTAIVAVFTTVLFGQVKTDIKPEKLPVCVLDWGKMNMKDYTVDKVQKYEDKSTGKLVVSYYLKYVKGKEHQWVQFSSDCGKVTKVPDGQLKPNLSKEKAAEPPKPVPGKEQPKGGSEQK